MEQEIQRRVLGFSKKTKALMEDETGIGTSVDDEDFMLTFTCLVIHCLSSYC